MAARRETIAEAEARLLGFLLRGDIEGFERATARARRSLELRKLAEYDDEFGTYEEFWDEDEIGGLPGCRPLSRCSPAFQAATAWNDSLGSQGRSG
jgi:hypothetical protein